VPLRSVSADPETLVRLQEAFDAAWAAVSMHCDPVAAPAARERLGSILVNLWSVEPGANLVAGSIERFFADEPLLELLQPAPLAGASDNSS
jgi:hypothetical protein